MNENKPMRAAIYARQSVSEPQGIDQQIAACRARILSEGWVEVETYKDNNTSATKLRGPSTRWAQMLTDYDSGAFDVIIAAKTARLLRSVVDVLEVTKPKRSVRVVTLDGADTETTMGSLVLTVLGAFGQAEIQEKEERAHPYRSNRHETGNPAPGKPPFGYRHVPKPQGADTRESHWSVVPEEAAIVRRIFKELNVGTGLWEIRAGLNADGLRTRDGKLWGMSTLRRMLINPAYAAKLTPKGTARSGGNEAVTLSECTDGRWEALVTEPDLIAARSTLLHEDRLRGPGSTSRRWLLPGLAFCSVCGGHIRSAKNRHLRGYRCATGHFHREADPIDSYVTHEALSVIMRANPTMVDEETGERIATLRTALTASRAENKELFKLYQRRVISADELETGRTKIAAETDRLEAELRELKGRNPIIEAVTADDLAAHWEGLPLSRKRALLSALISHIEISPVGYGVRVRTHEGVAATVRVQWRYPAHRMSLNTGHRLPSRGRLPEHATDEVAALLS